MVGPPPAAPVPEAPNGLFNPDEQETGACPLLMCRSKCACPKLGGDMCLSQIWGGTRLRAADFTQRRVTTSVLVRSSGTPRSRGWEIVASRRIGEKTAKRVRTALANRRGMEASPPVALATRMPTIHLPMLAPEIVSTRIVSIPLAPSMRDEGPEVLTSAVRKRKFPRAVQSRGWRSKTKAAMTIPGKRSIAKASARRE